jgi:hypothetical protein
MLRKVIIIVLFISSGVSLLDCQSMKNYRQAEFKVKSAYYQSWIVSEEEKGTDILLTLSGVREGLVIDSIVFRGVRLKAFVTKENKEVHIKSILTSGISRIKLEKVVVNLPDQLIYHYKGQRKSFPLTLIGKKTIYY